ncbi:3'-phosphoadenosine 5'-phosphosulfate sulfotransferase (PAPS reductase)/FAD synthetase [Actinokineospora iranica]|uniref:3'-phosphoadenosine 5'-phosphosulfate sulfotransferase (PAPS reductase)/FAD synthetase n=1 Tax=Actinokineospora iranica TaxID=1271860 RepID=A0A1G6VNR0_9PSEU|nr:3'-phosphoadenosine 5'-phosphosulfate sulfotransferase (PAPS reductase)/FAD synthetase [Actinokineospora iranica]
MAIAPSAPPACSNPCSRLLPAPADTAPVEFDWDAHDVVVVGDSGGKDSRVTLDTVCRQADAAGALHKVRVLHCDLGRTPEGHLVEWPGAEAVARRGAALYGVPFAVRRSSRWPSLLHRILDRGRWPGFFARYCTSEMKTAVGRDYIDELGNELALGRPVRAGYALGMRADESRNRARQPVLAPHRMSAPSKRLVTAWLPIHGLSESDVWSAIRSGNLPYHEAYDLGMRRLSCRLCPLAARDDLFLSARLNPEVAREFAAAEERMGSPFKNGLTMRQVIERASGG